MVSTSGKVDFGHFCPEFLAKLQAVSDAYLDPYDEHAAFVYLAAELLETTHDSIFTYSDGRDDCGIDFFVCDDQSFVIAQCKFPDADKLLESNKPISYDDEPLNELLAGINMLLDSKGTYNLNPHIRRLRADYQQSLQDELESTSLKAYLVIFGTLTSSAKQTFDSHRSRLLKKGVSLVLIEWLDIYKKLYAIESPADMDIKLSLRYNDDRSVLRQNDYCYLLASAFDFYEAFRKYEWNLFEWNVRFQIPNSPINRRIVETLKSSKGRKRFHHYNNGLLITCKDYKHSSGSDLRITINGPQIVNGCQTVRAICEAYESLSPDKQAEFRDSTLVQVKIIRSIDPEFISELVVSTNDQNPMNPRNLKSNSSEQKDLQKKFNGMPKMWFYQRKDGEWLSLLTSSSKMRGFRKSNYALSGRKARVIDNQELAKAWYAFIGYSHESIMGGFSYFEDEADKPYRLIFKSVPSPAYWKQFEKPEFQPRQCPLDDGTPTVHQYLLALASSKYVKQRRVSPHENRRNALLRGIQRGKLRANQEGKVISPKHEQDLYLVSDDDYYINNMIGNMHDVLVELTSFVICIKYIGCDAAMSRKLVEEIPAISDYINSNFEGRFILTSQDGQSLLGPIYEYLLYCVKQYYLGNIGEIKSAPRFKTYLAQRGTINKFRACVFDSNSLVADYNQPWKKMGKPFLDSLPRL